MCATPTGFSFNGEFCAAQGFSCQSQAQGIISGYTSGTNGIDKFPFTADGSSTDIAELSQARDSASGQSSSVSGYTSGGKIPAQVDTIDKFPFSSDSPAIDVGELSPTTGISGTAGHQSTTNGYTSGIQKFPFSSDSPATDIGELTCGRSDTAGSSSQTHGYTSGGLSFPGGPEVLAIPNVIDKFPFTSDTSSTDVGDLVQSVRFAVGQSSTTFGYSSGGAIPTGSGDSGSVACNTIQKYPFSSDTNASDVGELASTYCGSAGQSSSTNGYRSGGKTAPADFGPYDRLEKFPFSVDAPASDIGELANQHVLSAGQQV